MSSIGKHNEASSREAVLGRIRDDERPSLSEVVVAFAEAGTRPVPARALVIAAAEALLEYASVGRPDNDRESTQWGSVGQTEAIELSDCGWLQISAQRGARFWWSEHHGRSRQEKQLYN